MNLKRSGRFDQGQRKLAVLSLVSAFVLMVACTPSSLYRSKQPVGSVTSVAMPQKPIAATDNQKPSVVPDFTQLADTSNVAADSLVFPSSPDTLPVITAPLADEEMPIVHSDSLVDSMAVGVGASSSRKEGTEDRIPVVNPDIVAPVNEIVEPAAIKTKRDTTLMDSLELLVYKHNKAIDDSLARDSINRKKKNGIDSPVKYSATDSLVYVADIGKAYLYGNSHVEYQNMDLKSENIDMCLDSSLVHATGVRDSATGKLTGTPVFSMGSDTYESDTMAFNFKTKKGLITQVYTQQEDGYMTSELSKRSGNGDLFLHHGRYTTCSEPHPDFYIAMSRAKVRPGRDVVFGPAYLVVCDVPLPLAVPYGFFPFSKSYSSGFIMPTYGDETERGFYLRDGGYYFAISDKMDLKLIGEIYTKGSWGLSGASNYRKRYKYSGSVNASYQNSVTGERNMPDYSKQTSFKVQWSHRQDPKANPFSSLSASVNFATSSYEKNNLTSMYNPQSMTQSTRTSSVSYSTNFSSIGMSLSTTMNLNQNMRDSSISLTLPDLNISISRFYPFKRKKMAGKEKWYEKIAMSYTGHFSNSISTKEEKLLHSDFKHDWKNGMTHSIPISASFTVLDVINLTPSFNLSDKTGFMKQRKYWDEARQTEMTDTIDGFYNVYNWNLSLSASTKLYGLYVPSRKLFGDKIQAIRHVLTPTVNFSYAPDFSASRYGYYDTYQKTEADGTVTLVEYSPYQIGQLSPPGKGMTGSIQVDLSNNVEMKLKGGENDSVNTKKISLIDELGASMSYNLAAKVRPLSDLNMRIRLKLTKSYTFNLNAVFASYVYEADSVGASPRVSDHTTYWGLGKLGRFQGMSQNFSYTLDNKKISDFINKLRGFKIEKKTKKEETQSDDDEDNDVNTNLDKDLEEGKHGARRESAGKAETDEDGYMAFSFPWSISIGYGISMREDTRREKFNYDTMRYPFGFTQNLNISGNLRISDGWNITFSSGYDFDNKKISMTTASLSRDLHCFNMSCSVVLAPYTSYNFSFRCNASTLTDALKYDKRSSYSNSVQWY